MERDPDSGVCNVCGVEFPVGSGLWAVLDHVRLLHPDLYGDGPQRWPDGSLVVHEELAPAEFATRPTCPDCAVAIGTAHEDGCDVARCWETGGQRLACGLFHDHDCGQDVWSGRWPGDEDCERLGWFDEQGRHDLNRLAREAVWDRTTRRWVGGV